MSLCLSACSLNAPGSGLGQTEAAASVGQLTTANQVMQGICFESAFDAAGRTFVLRDEAELGELFDLADNSRLCRQSVKRETFDYSGGAVLAGIWSKGTGCKAQHDLVKTRTNAASKKVRIILKFVTEGDCNYELVRPYWVGVSGAKDYQVKIKVK